MKYPIIIQKDPNSDYGVIVPDLPGCFSAGATVEEAIDNAAEAVLTHAEGLLADNDSVPTPTSITELKKHHREASNLWALVEVDFSKLSEKMARVNISVPENLLSKIDSYAMRTGASRSGMLVNAALEYISNHSEGQ
jgi:predicted RNase H-like HicB family nuclease